VSITYIRTKENHAIELLVTMPLLVMFVRSALQQRLSESGWRCGPKRPNYGKSLTGACFGGDGHFFVESAECRLKYHHETRMQNEP
jgi:hypothetical protein